MKNKARILVIDDDADLIDILTVKMRHEGFDISAALSADSGLKELETVSVNLILLDIMMPRVSGFDLLKKIKQSQGLKKIPVILLTAAGAKDQIEEGLSMGADDFVIKPFSFDDLLNKIRAYISSA